MQINLIFRTGVALLLGIVLGTAASQELSRDRLAKVFAKPPMVRTVPGTSGATFSRYRDDDIASATFGVELCVLAAKKGAGRLRVKDLRAHDSPVHAFESNLPMSAIGVLNGGFFGLDHAGASVPLGLVRSEGKTLNKKHPWTSGGMIVATGANASVIPISRYPSSGEHAEVVQSKPLLVEGGQDGIRSATADRFDRSSVALDKRGNLYFFVLHQPGGAAGSLAEFSYLLLHFRSANGEAITEALAMDGGPGSHLFIPLLKVHCGSGMPNFVPNALYIE